MGGFEVPVVRLEFADSAFDGFEVDAYMISAGSLLRISQLRNIDWQNDRQAAEEFDKLAREITPYLADWNLTRKGEPVVLSSETLVGQGYRLVFAIANALLDATAGVSPPLSEQSNNGEPSEVPPMSMEISSENPES